MTEVLTKSVAEIRTVVERRFRVYDVQFDENVVAFFVDIDPLELESSFDALKDDLREEDLIPVLRHEGGEHRIFVVHKPERQFRSERVNLVLFILTWLTTTLAGVEQWFSYANANLDRSSISQDEFFRMIWLDPSNWVMGFLTFALPLMFILGVHEMGHYVLTKRHRMAASLPFFIPLPFGSPPIGTLGAFISMREPIPSRKALLDIGASGPIAGFLVAIPVLLVGFVLMKLQPVMIDLQADGLVTIGTPLLWDLLAIPFAFSENQVAHPTAFAGWVGLFVTAINLFPAGQLDGGHIATAMFGEKARYLSYGTVALLAVLGFFGIPGVIEPYSGWLIFAILILFLGANHPPTLNSITPLDARRWIVGGLTFALFVLCFTPVPLTAAG